MLEFDAGPHLYTWNREPVPGVTNAIRAAVGSLFDHVAPGVLERAQGRGRAVHYAVELDHNGELDEASIDPQIAGYFGAWRAFRTEYPCRVLAAEKPLYSKRYGFAGTPDVTAALTEGVAVIDLKTGLPGPLAAMQLAAYAELIRENLGMDAPVRRFTLRLLATGRYRFDEYTSPGDWANFLACLRVQRLRERIAA